MLALLTGWIPVIGPIINGAVSVFTKMQDTQVVKIQTDAQTAQLETTTSAQIIEATKDDMGIRFMRDLICAPVAIWAGLIGWDTIVADRWSWLQFHVEPYPTTVSYLPYAVIVFLLGNIGINAWTKR